MMASSRASTPSSLPSGQQSQTYSAASSMPHLTPTFLFTSTYNQNFQYFNIPKETPASQLQSMYLALTEKFRTLLSDRYQELSKSMQNVDKQPKAPSMHESDAIRPLSKPKLNGWLHAAPVDANLSLYFYELCMCVANGSFLPHRAAEFVMKKLQPLCSAHLEEVGSTLLSASTIVIESGGSMTQPDSEPTDARVSNSGIGRRLNLDWKHDEKADRLINGGGNHQKNPEDQATLKKKVDEGRAVNTASREQHGREAVAVANKSTAAGISEDTTGKATIPKSTELRLPSPNGAVGPKRSSSNVANSSVPDEEKMKAPQTVPLPSPFKDMLLDSIWLIFEMISNLPNGCSQSSRCRGYIGNLFIALEREQVVYQNDIAAYLDPVRLDSIRYSKLEAKGGLQGMNVKERTKRLYTLSTHNLMREHTTGYARLQTYLQEFAASQAKVKIKICQRMICEIVGNYSLCPSRTLGIMLDIYESNLNAKNQLLPLISMFSNAKITEVICFQLHLFTHTTLVKEQDEEKASQPAKPSQAFWLPNRFADFTGPSDNFYRLLAILLIKGLIELDSIYNFLEPADDLLTNLFEQLEQKYKSDTQDIKNGKPIPLPKGSGAVSIAPGGLQRSMRSDGAVAVSVETGNSSSSEGYNLNSAMHPSTFSENHYHHTAPGGSYCGAYYPYGSYLQQTPTMLSRPDRDRSDKEDMTKQDRLRKDRDRQQQEDEGKKRKELKEKLKNSPLASLPGMQHYLMNEDSSYKGLCEKIYCLRVGKFRLIAALIDMNGWMFAKRLLDHMTVKLKCLPYHNQPVFQSLKNYINWLIVPLLEKNGMSVSNFVYKHLPETSPRYKRCLSKGRSQMPAAIYSYTRREKASYDPTWMPSYWFGLMAVPATSNPSSSGIHKTNDAAHIQLSKNDTTKEEASGDMNEKVKRGGWSLYPVTSEEAFFEVVGPVLKYIGFYSYMDTHLLKSVLMIIESYILENISDIEQMKYSSQLDDMFASDIFPAMGYLMEGSGQIAEYVWRALHHLPAARRYRIYSSYYFYWMKADRRPTGYSSEIVLSKVRKLLKRTTSDLLKDTKSIQVRAITSEITGLAVTNPFPVAAVVISQCEMFDENMVSTLTEAIKHVNALTSDIFAFCLIECQQTRHLRAGGKWDPGRLDAYIKPKKLVNMGTLAGRFLRRHPKTDMRPIVQSTIHQICHEFHPSVEITLNGVTGTNERYPHELQGYFLDKEHIEQLLQLMGGVTKLPEAHSLTEDQIFSQGGGPLLRSEIMLSGDDDGGPDKTVKKAFLHAIQDKGFVTALLLPLAKLRMELLFDSRFSKSFKLLGSILDDVHWFHLQLIEFLQQMLSPAQYSKILPDAVELFNFFEHPMAWSVVRHCLYSESEFTDGGELSKETPTATGRLGTVETSAASSEQGEGEDDRTSATDIGDASHHGGEEVLTDWMLALQPILKGYITEEVLGGLSLRMYLTFWRLSLSDIYVPNDQYRKMVEKLDGSIKQNERKLEELQRGSRSMHSSFHKLQHDREEALLSRRLKKLNSRRIELKREWEKQIDRHERVKASLTEQCGSWISHHRAGPSSSRAIVKYMVAPRLLNSEADALFCAFFVNVMVQLHTPLFNLFDFSNTWTKMITPLVRSCTEREAQLIGIFVNELLRPTNSWLKDEALFEKEAFGNPCFGGSFKPKPDNTIKHEQLIGASKKWESRILKPLKNGLGFMREDEHQKVDWIDQKSIIIFLSRCHENFPITYEVGKQLKDRLKIVAENATKKGWNDIKLAANSLVTTFERYEKGGSWYNSPQEKVSDNRAAEVSGTSSPVNSQSTVDLPRKVPSKATTSVKDTSGTASRSGKGTTRLSANYLGIPQTTKGWAANPRNIFGTAAMAVASKKENISASIFHTKSGVAAGPAGVKAEEANEANKKKEMTQEGYSELAADSASLETGKTDAPQNWTGHGPAKIQDGRYGVGANFGKVATKQGVERVDPSADITHDGSGDAQSGSSMLLSSTASHTDDHARAGGKPHAPQPWNKRAETVTRQAKQPTASGASKTSRDGSHANEDRRMLHAAVPHGRVPAAPLSPSMVPSDSISYWNQLAASDLPPVEYGGVYQPYQQSLSRQLDLPPRDAAYGSSGREERVPLQSLHGYASQNSRETGASYASYSQEYGYPHAGNIRENKRQRIEDGRIVYSSASQQDTSHANTSAARGAAVMHIPSSSANASGPSARKANAVLIPPTRPTPPPNNGARNAFGSIRPVPNPPSSTHFSHRSQFHR